MVLPGSPNTVPGRVRFTVDLRDADSECFEALKWLALSASSTDPVRINRAVLLDNLPCSFDEGVIASVSRAAARQGFPHTRLVSGAFHDALSLAGICRTGMIFVRSRSGISHHPDEYTAPAELAAGAQVLADVVTELANQ